MSIFQALVLGIVQGVTEFLPISSSGHLVLFQQYFGLSEDILVFDVFLHLATLGAIIIFFGKTLFKVTFKEWFLIGVGTIPAVIIGLLFKDQIENLFASGIFLGVEFMMTGLINFYIDRRLNGMKLESTSETVPLTVYKSLAIGVAQALAIIPGISRSGSTVAGAVSFKMSREEAFRFSFLLAIPALAGAGVLQLSEADASIFQSFSPLLIIIGSLSAFGSGIASLALFKYVIDKAKFEWFGWYCLSLGSLILFFQIT
ncbi:MAG TPA: undecaprenyl-diphosphate phosphatase [Patescibacteria group bacterium]